MFGKGGSSFLCGIIATKAGIMTDEIRFRYILWNMSTLSLSYFILLLVLNLLSDNYMFDGIVIMG